MPSLADLRATATAEDRVTLLEQVHPVYSRYSSDWHVNLDAYDGSGGFLDGTYLWRYPRELEMSYRDRRRQARYHNYVEALVDLYVRHVFGQVSRTTDDPALEAWWGDVDGQGTSIEEYLRGVTALALAAGHVGVLVDKPQVDGDGPAQVDRTAQPFLTTYAPTSITDWRVRRSTVTAVKLKEAAAMGDLFDPVGPDGEDHQWLLWDDLEWARYSRGGEFLGGDEHALGQVPLAVLRPKRSQRFPFIGKPLLNAGVVQALYNRSSEEDEVLRNQAFSLFVIELPFDATAADVEEAKSRVGQGVGTTSVLVTKGSTQFRTPDMAVPERLSVSQRYLIEELYRMAHVRWRRDSLDAESAEAIRLQHAELNQMLVGLAQDLTRFEHQLARLYFAWQATDADQAFERAAVSVEYPSEFFMADLATELTALAQAMAFGLGETFERRMKRRIVTRVDPEISDADRETVEAEIDQLPSRAQSGPRALGDELRARSAERLAEFAVS